MDELMLDGSAIAGLLQEVFAVEMTTAIGTCGGSSAAGSAPFTSTEAPASCSATRTANNVLAKIVENDPQVWIDFHGIRTLELAV